LWSAEVQFHGSKAPNSYNRISFLAALFLFSYFVRLFHSFLLDNKSPYSSLGVPL
jgi:hypothetical protein